ncbi:MAG: sigma-E processing peptidase SpoIIGA, partial [Christensenellaceae bacterium]
MVYGEWVLILNFLVDGALLRITGRLWGYPAPWGRWALASALGAAGALLALCGPPWMGGWVMKAALPALMALVCWPLARRRLV